MSNVGTSSSYAIFSAQYPPHLGGIENFTYNLSHALVKRGDSVLVVTNDTNGIGVGVEDDEGVTLLRFPCHSFVDGRFPLLKRNSKSRELKKWLSRCDVDGVLVNARFYPHSLMGMRYARSKGLKPIVLDHGSAWLSFSNRILAPIVRAYERAITAYGKRYGASYSNGLRRLASRPKASFPIQLTRTSMLHAQVEEIFVASLGCAMTHCLWRLLAG